MVIRWVNSQDVPWPRSARNFKLWLSFKYNIICFSDGVGRHIFCISYKSLCSTYYRNSTRKKTLVNMSTSQNIKSNQEGCSDRSATNHYWPIFSDPWSADGLEKGRSEGPIRRCKARQLNLLFSVLSPFFLCLFLTFLVSGTLECLSLRHSCQTCAATEASGVIWWLYSRGLT